MKQNADYLLELINQLLEKQWLRGGPYRPKRFHIIRDDTFMEAIGVAHNGRNTGSGPARILAVFMGADGVPNTVMLKGDASVPVQPPPQ